MDPSAEEMLADTRATLARLEQDFLERCSPTEFVYYALEMKRIPMPSAIVIPGEWGPVQ